MLTLDDPLILLTSSQGDSRGAVSSPIDLFIDDSIYGAHVVAPPQWLAPQHGAVRIDLEDFTFTRCESLDDCLNTGPTDSTDWTSLSNAPCSTSSQLLAVDVEIEGTKTRLLLDTGAPTLLFSALFEEQQWGRFATRESAGQLYGSAGQSLQASRHFGAWDIQLGSKHPIRRQLSSTWTMRLDEGTPTHCESAGSLGIDALSECQLVVDDSSPVRGFLRCP